jgi:hypothetical protein
MSNFKKHVGRIRNTDRRCVVVYMQIPDNEQSALIVDTDALPDRFHDALMDVIDSNEGQQVVHLHTLLSRRILPDLGIDILSALHGNGQLRAMEIDNIVMYPAPNAPCPLRTIVDYINGNEAPAQERQTLENRVLENQRSDTVQAQEDIAHNILRQADDLSAEADKKREQAYRLVPNLRPQAEEAPKSAKKSKPQVTDSPQVTEASGNADIPADVQAAFDAAQGTLIQPVAEYNIVEDADAETQTIAMVSEVPAYTFNPGDPVEEFQHVDRMVEAEGNQVDTSDDAIQAFLDRAALREDMADKEAWEAKQPKAPVGRPRKDGQPAGAKPLPEKPRRGRPPKAKK